MRTGVDADTVLMGGSIITVDRKNPRAEAVAIRDGKFLRVGTTEEVKETIGKGTDVRELKGMAVVPGFIESHNHTLIFGLNLKAVDLSRVHSINEMLELLRTRGLQQDEGSWIIGVGYNQNELKEKRHPTRWDLDRIGSDHFVAIKHTSAHARVVNSKALALAGITKDTPDPEGGRIIRDEKTGDPTGVLFQFSAMSLVDDMIPKPSDKDLVDALTMANNVLLSQGITSATDAGTNIVDIPVHFAAFRVAVEKELLKVRHNLAIRSEVLLDYNNLDEELKNIEEKLSEMGIGPGLENEKLRIGPFKFITDGAISTATAATYEPYGADPRNQSTGELMISPEALTKVASTAHRLGFQLMVHGIGDRAIDASISAIERALQETPGRDARPRIEHCVMVNPQRVRKIKKLGILAVVQPAFLWGLGDNWISQVGRDRAVEFQPFRTLLDNDVLMAFSSDRPVVDGAPLLGIHTAVNQKTMNGQNYAPRQKISVEEALRCYTLNGAYTTFEENIKGSIEEGKLADLVVLAEDITKVASERIKDVQVMATMVGGEFFHENWA